MAAFFFMVSTFMFCSTALVITLVVAVCGNGGFVSGITAVRDALKKRE